MKMMKTELGLGALIRYQLKCTLSAFWLRTGHGHSGPGAGSCHNAHLSSAQGPAEGEKTAEERKWVIKQREFSQSTLIETPGKLGKSLYWMQVCEWWWIYMVVKLRASLYFNQHNTGKFFLEDDEWWRKVLFPVLFNGRNTTWPLCVD